MDNNKLYDYIENTYDRWVNYASHYIQRSKLPINPSEVVNDVLCTLLERDVKKLEHLLIQPAKGGTELDFFIMRIIKTSIYSPRSPFRYQRGQHCTCHLNGNVSAMESNLDSTATDIFSTAWIELTKMNVPEFEKKVFVWKFFDGNPISKWPGPESRRKLYHAYSRIFKQIVKAAKGKISY